MKRRSKGVLTDFQRTSEKLKLYSDIDCQITIPSPRFNI